MKIIDFLIIPLFISLPLMGISILFDRWVVNRGYSRGAKMVAIYSAIFMAFMKPVLFKNTSWWLYSVVALFAVTILVHQFEFRETWYHGSFWWKREISKKRKEK